ncbi:TetR/AcrR family transcriptional regulator [Ruania zhangjianzhongii]|uniref:TetR/AcrR family transcriptional regulator n=1 Tax=Ruania zhangjianzhongii TaxID=2603206 RepID=UPI00143D81A0|nr:TetR/AcrR family transcriptional regulator C-terminal domain-containing protein [Ruania zhangjianzhongii]
MKVTPSAQEAITPERIVHAAVKIADAEGLAAVTMRRLGAALDREAMTLYHYTPSKHALLAALIDHILGQIAHESARIAHDDWRDTVRSRCLAARRLMLRHPWAPALITAQDETPAAAWPIYELLIATVTAGGFDNELSHRTVHALGSMLFGFSSELFQPDAQSPEPDPAAMRAMAERFPHLARMASAVVHERDGALSMCDTRAEFIFTLDLVLDGLERARTA